MKTFALVHRNVCLNVICDDEFENVIKEHFCKSTKLIFENSKSPFFIQIPPNVLYVVVTLFLQRFIKPLYNYNMIYMLLWCNLLTQYYYNMPHSHIRTKTDNQTWKLNKNIRRLHKSNHEQYGFLCHIDNLYNSACCMVDLWRAWPRPVSGKLRSSRFLQIFSGDR